MTNTNKLTLIQLNEEEYLPIVRAFLKGTPLERWSTASNSWVDSFSHYLELSGVYRLKADFIPDTLDWTPFDKKWKYCARDKSGSVRLYIRKPTNKHYSWSSDSDFPRRIDDLLNIHKKGTIPWDESLIERPTDGDV